MGVNLLQTKVWHKRLHPKENAFTYHVYYLSFDIERLSEIEKGPLTVERRGLMSFWHKDHGARDGTDCRDWARGLCAKHDVDVSDLRCTLITLPRIVGYVFNPVSFWLFEDKNQNLRAVIAEVNNTFGESHSYVLAHEGGSPISADEWIDSDKMFHVSPFLEVKGRYHFRFARNDTKTAIFIDHSDAGEMILKTSIVGTEVPLTAASLWRCFIKIPLVSLKVMALIHWQALRLWLKGIKYRVKPAYDAPKESKWPSAD